MKSIRVLAVNDPAVYAYLEDSVTSITKVWEECNSTKINFDIVEWENYESILDKALEGNEVNYDIVMAPSFWIANLAASDKVIPFENYISKDYEFENIFPSVIDELSYNKKIVGVPSFTDGHILFYRKDKIELKSIVTVNDINKVMERLPDHTPRLALKASKNEIFLDFLPFLWDEGGELFDINNKPSFNTDKGIKALNNYISLKKYCPSGIESFGNNEVRDSIQRGEVYLGVSWSGQAAAIMDKSNNKFADNLNFATYDNPCNTTWTFLVNSNSKKIKASFDYLMFSTNKDNDLLSGRISGSPVRMSTYSNEFEQKNNPWYETNCLMLKNAKRIPPIESWKLISNNLYNCVYKSFTGALSAEEALVECSNKIMDAIKQEKNVRH